LNDQNDSRNQLSPQADQNVDGESAPPPIGAAAEPF
jgi:hypothetical protein